MYLVITRDGLLYQAIASLVKPAVTEHIRDAQDICVQRHRHASVILDTLYNNVLHTSLYGYLEWISPRGIYILSPFGIKHCFRSIPVVFIPRTLSPEAFRATVVDGQGETWWPEVTFTRRQHRVMTQVLQRNSDRQITNDMNISVKTLASYKFNIMLLTGLRRFSRLMTHRYAVYLRHDVSDNIQFTGRDNEQDGLAASPATPE